MLHVKRRPGGVLQFGGGEAAFGRLAADVDLQQNVLHDALLLRLFFNGFQQGKGCLLYTSRPAP